MKVVLCPGNCGLKTELQFRADPRKQITVQGSSACPQVTGMLDALGPVDGYAEVFSSFDTSRVYRLAGEHLRHVSCPVPVALLKGIEASAGLALPQDICIRMEKNTP